MKVVCDSCQAKYQVPDERVAGKKLKIRCKRCGATVLIRGDLLGVGGESAVGSELGQTLSGAVAPDMLDMSGADRPSVPPESIGLSELSRASQHSMLGDEDYEWHVSLDGDTQGPFSTGALQDWLNSTPSGWEAHVWREGFPDWLDARACAELGPAPVAPAMASLQDDEVPTQTFNATSFEGAAFMAEMAAAPRSAPRIQTQASQQSGAYAAQQDAAGYSATFGSSVASARPVSASSGGATYTPGPNPGFASGEASGLIDIRALASLARQSTTQIAKSADNTGAIKNARNTQHGSNGAQSASAAPKSSASGRPDASLSYGNDTDARTALAAQPTGFGRFDSLAPVSHSVSSNAALPLAILGGCALVAAAVLAAVLFNKKPAADTASTPVPVHQERQQSESAATAMPPGDRADTRMEKENKDKDKDKPAQKGAPNPDQHPNTGPGAEDEPTVAPASVEEAESDELSKAKRARIPLAAAEGDAPPAPAIDDKSKPKKDDKAVAQESPEAMLADRAKPVKQAPPLTVTPLGAAEEPKQAESAKAIPEPEPMLAAAAKPLPKPAPSANRSIDDLLTGATGDKPASSAVPAPAPTPSPAANPASNATAAEAEDLPDTPSRDEILAAMRGIEVAVRACSANETITGTAEVSVNIAGATGRVTSATVTGITGTVGSCIARAVRNARFPRFSKPTFSIKFPFRF